MKIDGSDLGCSIILILIIAFFITLFVNKDSGKEYLVEETNYIHSTDDVKRCYFIDAANRMGYKISRIKKSDALNQGKKICKECYSKDEQKAYNTELHKMNLLRCHLDDEKEWWELDTDKSVDYSKLYVYIDEKSILHINGDCSEAKGEMLRSLFDDVTDIASTCSDCVGREYCDFIYKKIYEGVYDSSQIKDVGYEDY